MNAKLIALLRQREALIANHDWRDLDPDAHLDSLKYVSEGISAWTAEHGAQADPRLRHYLASCSFAKALAHLESGS